MTKKPAQMNMFQKSEELPLFSGTPQSARSERFDPAVSQGLQTTMAVCRFCLDTGTIRATKGSQKLSFCNCPTGIEAHKSHLEETF